MSHSTTATGIVSDSAKTKRYSTILKETLPLSLASLIPMFVDTRRLETLASLLDAHLDSGPLGHAERILNVGSGPFASELFVAALQDRRIVAFDYTPEFIAVGKRVQADGWLPKVELFHADAMAVDFPPESFDAILLSDILYEEALDLSELLSYYRRFLAPRGLLYLDYMNLRVRWLWKLLGREKSYRRYDPCEVDQILADNGFRVLEQQPLRRGRGLAKGMVHCALRLAGESNSIAVAARLILDRAA